MKRLITLIVLMALAASVLLTGCNQASDTSTSTPAGTNAPAMPSTNAPAK